MRRNVIIPGTEILDIKAALTGARYQIFLAVPEERAPPSGFPVIYLLDANAAFGSMVETIRRGATRPETTGLRSAVIVGIGYPIEGIYDPDRRTFDYTSRSAITCVNENGAAESINGCDAFCNFIEQELKPKIAALCHTDPDEQIIFGHSLAGFFVLDLFCRNTHSFRSYIAASPSIWWDTDRVIKGVAKISPLAGSIGIAPRRMFVAVGEWEQALSPWQKDLPNKLDMIERQRRRAMIDNAREFVEAATKAYGADLLLRFEVMKNEDHASIVPLAISHGLRFALSGI